MLRAMTTVPTAWRGMQHAFGFKFKRRHGLL